MTIEKELIKGIELLKEGKEEGFLSPAFAAVSFVGQLYRLLWKTDAGSGGAEKRRYDPECDRRPRIYAWYHPNL